MNGPPRSKVIGRGRPRSTLVVWLAVLAGTAALGLLGQGRGVPAAPSGTAVAAASGASSASATVLAPAGRPPAVRPLATQPPIGEDGVMGGLVFGTAWRWLDGAVRD